MNLAEVVEFDFDPGDGITAFARLGGDLDILSVQAIGEELIGYAAAGSLVVDITDVHFLDSSGLKLLVDCAKTARSRGGHFALVCPESSVVLNVLEITGLLKVLSVRPSRDVDGAAARPM